MVPPPLGRYGRPQWDATRPRRAGVGGLTMAGRLSRVTRDNDPLTAARQVVTLATVGLLSSTDRSRVATAAVLAGVSLLLLASIPLSLSGGVADRPGMTYPGSETTDWAALAVVATFTLSGAALVRLRPGNAIGWLLLACGLLQSVQTSCEAYGARALTDPDGSLPLGLFAMWVATWTWLPAL